MGGRCPMRCRWRWMAAIWVGALLIDAFTVGRSAWHCRSAFAEDTAAAKMHVREEWQVISLGDDRVGYARQTQHRFRESSVDIVTNRVETHMKFKRFGQELKITTILHTKERLNGELLEFQFEMQNPPASSVNSSGVVEGSFLRYEMNVAGRNVEKRIPWGKDMKSPTYQDRAIEYLKLQPGKSTSFETFLPELGRSAQIRITVNGPAKTKTFDGSQRDLLSANLSNSLLPGMTTKLYLDAGLHVVKSETPYLGSQMIAHAVPAEEALKEITGKELDIVVNTLIPVKPIRHAHQTSKVVYRIRIPGEVAKDYFSTGDTQQVEAIDRETVKVTVSKAVIPTSQRIVSPGEDYLRATSYLQTGDFRVQQHARQAAAVETNPWRVACAMEEYVHRKLTKKNFSTATASAAEVAERLEGDCTEHATLLAAMLRVKQIPSRVAVGLVYIDKMSKFGGHMWTEAYIGGKWIPLDATLGQGGIGAAHIKLADSSFAEDAPAPVTAFLPLMNVLGNIDITVLDVE